MTTESQNNFTFRKDEKLCSQKAIDRLFSEGKSFIAYPLRVVYFVREEIDEQAQRPVVLISVSKRKFKRANKRNRVKRLVREAYRLNKSALIELCQEEKKALDIGFLYLKDELPTFPEIEKAINKAIAILHERIGENT